VTSSLARPAVLGGFDGTASLLGVIVFLLIAHPALIFDTALSGAVSSALSMAAGWWLSDDNPDGLAGSVVMGGATFCGALLPAVPFGIWRGPGAIAGSAVLCAGVAAVVATLRPNRGRGLALAETSGLLLVVAGVTAGLSVLLGGG
jgi:hypothetical protein